MRSSEIRDLTPEEMLEKRDDLYEELFLLRQKAATSHLENPKRITYIRRSIARINTILTEQRAEVAE